jgi:hypothetical protein
VPGNLSILSGTPTLDEDVGMNYGEGGALAIMSSVTIAGPGAIVFSKSLGSDLQ